MSTSGNDRWTMSDKAIIGFLDILGYKKLVNKMINDAEFVKRLENLMYGITVDHLRKLRDLEFDDPGDEAYFKQVVDTVKVRYIFDSIIFSLQVSDITFSSQQFDRNTSVLNCIETFFAFMADFSTLFIAKMGHLLRGGISIGSHYESERENCFFIFSEAHNKAVRLEQDAELPRILLDDDLLSFLKDVSYTHMDKFFYKDDDGRYCFDIYSISNIWQDKQAVLTDIRKGLILNMLDNASNERELAKLMYFAKYHNRQVSKDVLNYPQLTIDLSRFGKRV